MHEAEEMCGSAYLAVLEMGKGTSRIMGIAHEQQIVDRLIDDIQEQEAGLSSMNSAGFAHAGFGLPLRALKIRRLPAGATQSILTWSYALARTICGGR